MAESNLSPDDSCNEAQKDIFLKPAGAKK